MFNTKTKFLDSIPALDYLDWIVYCPIQSMLSKILQKASVKDCLFIRIEAVSVLMSVHLYGDLNQGIIRPSLERRKIIGTLFEINIFITYPSINAL